MAELPQQALLDKIRSRAESTPEVVGLLVLGSFAAGTADAFSDLDLGLYVADEALAAFDLRGWLEPIAPVAAVFTNEYASTVLFGDLVRAEVHFGSLTRADDWSTLAGLVAYPSLRQIVLVDKTGTLSDRVRPLVGPMPLRGTEDADRQFGDLVDALLVADACRRRGEIARALAHLASSHGALLRLARLAEGATDEWVAPTRGLERSLSASAYQRYALTTAPLDNDRIRTATAAAWQWGVELAVSAGANLLDEQVMDAIGQELAPPLPI